MRHFNRFKSAVLFLFLAASASCVPFPSSTFIAPALTGQVVDSQSRQPIAGATVEHRFDDEIHRSAKTASDGTFSVKALSQFHWGIQIGIALNHRLPHPKVHGSGARTTLTITHPDYHMRATECHFHETRENREGEEELVPDTTDYRIELKPLSP